MPASEARRCAETTMPLAASTAGREASWPARGQSSIKPSKHMRKANADHCMAMRFIRDVPGVVLSG